MVIASFVNAVSRILQYRVMRHVQQARCMELHKTLWVRNRLETLTSIQTG